MFVYCKQPVNPIREDDNTGVCMSFMVKLKELVFHVSFMVELIELVFHVRFMVELMELVFMSVSWSNSWS